MSSLGRFKSMILTLSFLANAATDPSGYVGSKVCSAAAGASTVPFFRPTWAGPCVLRQISALLPCPRKQRCRSALLIRTLVSIMTRSDGIKANRSPTCSSSNFRSSMWSVSGENGLTFLIRRGAYLFQAPLSFYSKIDKWDLSPGYETVDLGFTRPAPEACITCHTGRSNAVRQPRQSIWRSGFSAALHWLRELPWAGQRAYSFARTRKLDREPRQTSRQAGQRHLHGLPSAW